MANTLLTIDQITNEALRLAHEKSSFLGTINRQFDEEFGRVAKRVIRFVFASRRNTFGVQVLALWTCRTASKSRQR